MRWLWRGLAALSAVLLGGWALAQAPAGGAQLVAVNTLFKLSQAGFPNVVTVEAPALKERLAAGEALVLVDVRPLVERGVSIIPGAISTETLLAEPDLYRDKTVVTYCTIGARSGVFAKELMADGWTVENLGGSLLSWTFAGGDLVDSSGEPTVQVHVYGRTWAIVADGYEAVITDDAGQVVRL